MLYVLITVKKSCSHSSFVYYCSFLINKLMKYLYMSYCFVSQINAFLINKNELIINKNFNSQIPMSKMKFKWKNKVCFVASWQDIPHLWSEMKWCVCLWLNHQCNMRSKIVIWVSNRSKNCIAQKQCISWRSDPNNILIM